MDKFSMQILFPHWSKWKTHDQLLGSDWRREDKIQLRAKSPKVRDVIKTNILNFIFPYRKCEKLYFILFHRGNANI